MKHLFIIASLILGFYEVFAADFSAVSPSGDMLYYKIIDHNNHKVCLVHPGTTNWGWGGYTEPTGNLIIPSTVYSGGIAYTITLIDSFAFSYCENITSLELPPTLDTIYQNAFSYCYGLNSIIIPDSVSYIGDEAFINDTNLSYVVIGKGVRYIGHFAFAYTSIQRTIRFRASYPNINTTGGFLVGRSCFWSSYEPNNVFVWYEVPCGSYSRYYSCLFGVYNPNLFVPLYETPSYDFTVVSSDTNMGDVAVITSPGCYDEFDQPGVAPYYHPTTEHLNAEFNATANYGYHFSHWSDGDTSSNRSLIISSDTVFYAYFNPDTFSVSVSTNNTSFGFVYGGGNYPFNSYIELEAIPENHYHFLRWSDGNQDNPRHLQVIEDFSLCAIFAIDTYQVSVYVNDMQNGQVTGGGLFEFGRPCTIYATPYSGYGFSQWSDGSTYNPYSFAVIEDVSITAIILKKYTITCLSADASMGTVTGSHEYLESEMATITAIPYSGYRFDHWQDNNMQNPRTITVTGNATYTAYFVSTQEIDDVIADAVDVYILGGQIVVEAKLNDEICIYDIVGRKVDGGRKTRFDVPTPGVYLVKIGPLPPQKVVVVK